MELKKLMGAAAAQAELLQELLVLLERETSEMGDVNVAAMAKINQAKEELLKKIADQSTHLKQAIASMAAREGLYADAALGAVAEHFSKKGNGELRAIQRQLSGTADRIQRIAAINREIAERFASTIGNSLNLLTMLINQSNVYGATGGYQQRPTGAVMINREA